MFRENLIIILILMTGIAFNNKLNPAATGVLLVVKFLAWRYPMQILTHNSLDIGILFLLIAVLIPLSKGEYGLSQVIRSLTSAPGLLAVVSGVTAAYLCGKGMILLQMRPEIIVGMIVGTIIGVVLFKGIPVGPLAAAGVTALLFSILGIYKK